MLSPAAILAAHQRIAPLIAPTPLERSAPFSAHSGAEIFLKLECAQITGSFKLRGASNALLSDPARTPVVACSAGNHALGIAHAAAATGIAATLVLPKNASPAKIAALQRYPVTLRLEGATYDEAEQFALALAAHEQARFISPYNHPAVIAGQGTLAVELLNQLPTLDTLLVSVSGGGLISGIGLWAKAVNPNIRLVGVQPRHAPAMHAALAAGQIVPVSEQPTIADALAGGIEPGSITFELVRQLVDELYLVEERAIRAAMRSLIDEHHLIVEGGAAVAIAPLFTGQCAVRQGERIAIILCGRNVSSAVVREIMAEPA